MKTIDFNRIHFISRQLMLTPLLVKSEFRSKRCYEQIKYNMLQSFTYGVDENTGPEWLTLLHMPGDMG
jgi:hypothetical protein